MATVDWSRYARQYDRVICRNTLYRKLLGRLSGADGVLPIPPAGGKVLDLGGGTGRLANALVLADETLHVTLIDKDPTMLSVCRQNSRRVLTDTIHSPGIRVVQRDLGAVASDQAIGDHEWDLVFVVNVLYSLDDPEGLLEWALRVLRCGGELRLTEPRRDTDVNAVMEAVVSEANEDPALEDYRMDLEAVTQFNTSTLAPHLHRWTTGEMIDLLRRVGFRTVAYATEEVYAGQSMLISARK